MSAPVVTSGKGGKRGSWFTGGSRRGSAESESRPSAGILSTFDGWNCTSAFGAVSSHDAIVIALEQQHEDDLVRIQQLEASVKQMQKELERIKGGGAGEVAAGSGGADAAGGGGVSVADVVVEEPEKEKQKKGVFGW
jgi:hypothetical protein